ncbi:bis(5'-nucleosyl)-tetraphosphatase, symmetrical [Deinococcus carri]|uniref:Bis(5'-nucleosyl)-tetraphosphatase, symmetrical n=1 Tax=Deinococcus carri TaxID=1211323 RepID=A0ABP9WA45_9DEIO
MNIPLPELCLVALVGASSAGKSTFAARHFLPTEVLSSDFFRALVSDDENSLEATGDAFDSLFFVAGKRLTRGRLTVVDATSVRPDDRRRLVDLARAHDVLPVAIVLDLPRPVLEARHTARTDRDFRPEVIGRQVSELHRTLRGLQKEGFRHVWVLHSEEEVDAARVSRVPLYTNRKELTGPFDFIGDVHGCLPELRELLTRLGYGVEGDQATPPPGRTAVFVGDLVDRGPDSAGVLRLVMNMVRSGAALGVPGNHDEKLKRALDGKAVKALHGLDVTLAQLEEAGPEFRREVRGFIDGLVSHLVLDGGRVVVAHAGLPERYQGRSSGRVRSFALYGDVDGSQDELGLPVRRDWAADYRGAATVIYGHTPVAQPRWVNRTLNIDTGCAFGGALTALRYPEMELVSVPAHAQYAVPARPLAPAEPEPDGETLDLADFLKGGRIETRTFGGILVREGERAAAVETFSRFGVDPRWAVYLPPTMSPVETSAREGSLEHPAEAFAYFRGQGVSQVVCEEKHMGSRAVLVLARDEAAARSRFGVESGTGCIYTRTGRPFFQPQGETAQWEADVLARARAAVTAAGLWETLDTGWLVLDAEILPWSLKAGELIRGQYAAVGAAGNAALPAAVTALEAAAGRGVAVGDLLDRTRERAHDLAAYREAYRAYVRRVGGPEDVRILPFHLLASEGRVHTDRDHLWHLETLGRLADAAPTLFGWTVHRLVTLGDATSEAEATAWWEALTASGGEGMVVKPLAFLDPERRNLQPAVKVRGREYLRIIYGPEYTRPEHLARLRARHLGAKRARALREFHLGLEALSRFVDCAGTARVHECVLGVLALESDPIDARL